MKNKIQFLPLLSLLFFFTLKSNGQDTLVFYFGKSKAPVPFVAIKVDKSYLFSDIQGKVITPKLKSGQEIEITHPLFRTQNIYFSEKQIELELNNETKINSYSTDKKAEEILTELYSNRKKLDPFQHAPYYHESYNKFIITCDSIEISNSLIGKISKKWFTTISEKDTLERHLFISETTTQRRYQNTILQDEHISGIKISGIEKPTLATVNSQLQSFSIYQNFIKILGSIYLNPIHKNGNKRFELTIEKTFPTKSDTLILIKFKPKRKLANEAISGYYWYSTKHKCILFSIYQPQSESKDIVNLVCQLNSEIQPNLFFPTQNMTLIYGQNVGVGKHKTHVYTITQNYFSNFNTDTCFEKKSFHEIAVTFNQDQIINSEDYWKNKRISPLTTKELNTYNFYKNLGNIKNFDNYVVFFEKLYSKEIPANKIIFDLKESVLLNDYEVLRLGIGAHTSKKASDLLSGGVYFGYGFRDTDFKYRINFDITPKSKYNFKFQLNFFRKLIESGGLDIPYSTDQYSSESLRKIGIYKVERLEGINLHFSIEPFKYARLGADYTKFQGTPSQVYEYKNEIIENEFYNEIAFHSHYAFGKRYFKIIEKKFPFNSPYPEIWLNFSKQLPESESRFNYTSLDFRAEASLRLLGIGFLKLRFGTGFRNGNIPLWKLYNGTGSKGFLSVTYNSFETMNFNEFLSDRYTTLFVTHDIGNFNITKNIKPRLVLAANSGIGTLKNPYNYGMVKFKTMDKGFFETGFMINDILYQNFALIKMTVGVGYYQRLGSYRFSKNLDNSIFKFVFKFII